MEYTHPGRSGLLVSKLCPGAMAFGNHCIEKEACRIIGTSEASQIESSARALEVRLTDARLKQPDEIFPPMGEVPEAYAW